MQLTEGENVFNTLKVILLTSVLVTVGRAEASTIYECKSSSSITDQIVVNESGSKYIVSLDVQIGYDDVGRVDQFVSDLGVRAPKNRNTVMLEFNQSDCNVVEAGKFLMKCSTTGSGLFVGSDLDTGGQLVSLMSVEFEIFSKTVSESGGVQNQKVFTLEAQTGGRTATLSGGAICER